MFTEKNTPRWLGAAFVFVFAASLAGGLLRSAAEGTQALGGTADIGAVLVSISQNLPLMRAGLLVELLNTVGIVVLAALLYVVLRKQNGTLALIALGWWLAEAAILAGSRIGAYALVPLSQEYVAAGMPQGTFFHTLGEFLHNGVAQVGYDIHMLFFCLGALVWYFLFYQSRVVPRVVAGWGLVAVFLVTIASFVRLWNPAIEMPIWLYVPYIPFELFIGLWLLVAGSRAPVLTSSPAQPA